MNITVRTDKKDIKERLISGMGIAYLLFLVWAILWKCGIPFIGDGAHRAINLLPFNYNTKWEMQFNLAIFVPFGFFLSAIKPERKKIWLILTTLLVSFVLEIIQYILAIGFSDVTDLLLNTLGGVVGIGAFYALKRLFGRHERKATFVICILLTLLVLYMTVSFILVGQLYIGFMMIKL
jgi:glycopeptide antibiotics resistance protein